MTRDEHTPGIVERLRESARAFRNYPLYDSEGDGFHLTAQADECDEAADLISELVGALEAVTVVYKRDNPMRTADVHDPSCTCMRCAIDFADAAIAKARGGAE